MLIKKERTVLKPEKPSGVLTLIYTKSQTIETVLA
jgi:hypothetical protein